jgi:hypothetical protein
MKKTSSSLDSVRSEVGVKVKTKDEKRSYVVLVPLDLCQRYTIRETSAYLRQSHTKTYADIRAGLLKTFKDGRRRYVNGTAIIERSRAPRPRICAGVESSNERERHESQA